MIFTNLQSTIATKCSLTEFVIVSVFFGSCIC